MILIYDYSYNKFSLKSAITLHKKQQNIVSIYKLDFMIYKKYFKVVYVDP